MQHPNGANFGHGHVFPREDGVKMRCSGTLRCPVCESDKTLLEIIEANLANRPEEADLEQKTYKFDTYVCTDKDSNWEDIAELIQTGEIPPMTEDAQRNFVYQLLEVKLNVELDIETGAVTILGVRDVPLTEPVKNRN